VSQEPSAARASGYSILVVDAQPETLDATKHTLELEGHEVLCVDGSSRAAELFHEYEVQLVLVDYPMDRVAGEEFIACVHGHDPRVQILMQTGDSGETPPREMLQQLGIQGYHGKTEGPAKLLSCVDAALKAYEQLSDIERTLHGAILTLTDLLAFVAPMAFGRATRAKHVVSRLAGHLRGHGKWQVETAAILSQIGCTTLPPDLTEKLYRGWTLAPAEEEVVRRLPAVADQLLADIPGMEPVRKILAYQDKHFDGTGTPETDVSGSEIPWGARVLKIALDFDLLEMSGLPTETAMETLRSRWGWYDLELLDRFAELLSRDELPDCTEPLGDEEREVPVDEIQSGMIFGQNVKTPTGMLIIAHGQPVTAGVLARIQNFSAGAGAPGTLRMILPAPGRRTEGRGFSGPRSEAFVD